MKTLRKFIQNNFVEKRDYEQTLVATWEKFKLGSVKAPKGQEELVKKLLENAVMQVIYSVDKTLNDFARGIKAGTYDDKELAGRLKKAATPKKGTPEFDALWKSKQRPPASIPYSFVQKVRTQTILETWKVNGKPVGRMTGEEVRSYLERERGQEYLHGCNVLFFTWLSDRVMLKEVVEEVVTGEEAEATWASIAGRSVED